MLDVSGMGRPLAAVSLLIRLAWAALWQRSPYGRMLKMFGIGRPFGLGRPDLQDLLFVFETPDQGSLKK